MNLKGFISKKYCYYSYSFIFCIFLEKVEILSSIISIDNRAIYKRIALKQLIINSSSFGKIGLYVFEGIKNLEINENKNYFINNVNWK